MVLPTTLKNQ